MKYCSKDGELVDEISTGLCPVDNISHHFRDEILSSRTVKDGYYIALFEDNIGGECKAVYKLNKVYHEYLQLFFDHKDEMTKINYDLHTNPFIVFLSDSSPEVLEYNKTTENFLWCSDPEEESIYLNNKVDFIIDYIINKNVNDETVKNKILSKKSFIKELIRRPDSINL